MANTELLIKHDYDGISLAPEAINPGNFILPGLSKIHTQNKTEGEKKE